MPPASRKSFQDFCVSNFLRVSQPDVSQTFRNASKAYIRDFKAGTPYPSPRPQLPGYDAPSPTSTSYSHVGNSSSQSGSSAASPNPGHRQLTHSEIGHLAKYLNHPDPQVAAFAYERILANVDGVEELNRVASYGTVPAECSSDYSGLNQDNSVPIPIPECVKPLSPQRLLSRWL